MRAPTFEGFRVGDVANPDDLAAELPHSHRQLVDVGHDGFGIFAIRELIFCDIEILHIDHDQSGRFGVELCQAVRPSIALGNFRDIFRQQTGDGIRHFVPLNIMAVS